MTNPFKYTYQIAEHKNANGESKFVVTYASAFWRLVAYIDDRIWIYIDGHGYLCLFPGDGRHRDLEAAKQAIENHKQKSIESQNAKYKKLAIHYVE